MLDILPRGPAPANDDSEMFELAPVSLWLEDFSGVRTLFDAWRADGVTDLRAHFAANPGCVAHARTASASSRSTEDADAIRGRRFRRAHRQSRLGVPRRHAQDPRRRACQLWDGQSQFTSQTVNYTLGGRRLDIQLKGAVLPGHEARWDRVLVAIEDVTEREDARRRTPQRAVCARPVRAFAGVAVGRGFQRGQASARRGARARHRRFPRVHRRASGVRRALHAAKSACST